MLEVILLAAMLKTQGMNPDKSAYPFYSNWFRIVYCRWLVFADRHQTSEVGQRLDMCCGVYMCFFLAPAFLCLCCVLWIDFQVYNKQCLCVFIVLWVVNPYKKDRSCQHCTVISRPALNYCISSVQLLMKTGDVENICGSRILHFVQSAWLINVQTKGLHRRSVMVTAVPTPVVCNSIVTQTQNPLFMLVIIQCHRYLKKHIEVREIK